MERKDYRVLAVGAHPDDVEFMCTGTMQLLKDRGAELHLATLTGGDLGTLPEVDWENEVNARFTKALSGKLYVQMLYSDRDLAEGETASPRLKQTLGLGLSLAWPSGEEG